MSPHPLSTALTRAGVEIRLEWYDAKDELVVIAGASEASHRLCAAHGVDERGAWWRAWLELRTAPREKAPVEPYAELRETDGRFTVTVVRAPGALS